MANLDIQTISLTGTEPSYTAAAGGGDAMTPGEHAFLHVKNGSGSEITVTLVTPITSQGLAVADQTVAVPAGEERMVRVPPERYRNPSTGLASITYSDVTTVTVAALRA